MVTGCASQPQNKSVESTAVDLKEPSPTSEYKIGPGDVIDIFVWRNADVSITVSVRPDGKVSSPLVEDMQAIGKTPTELARDIEGVLSSFIKKPAVTVIVKKFGGLYSQQVRVVGAAAVPLGIPFQEKMTLLDVMIAVGGLTEFASGNKASIVRAVNGKQELFRVRLDDLLRDGDISENIEMVPGDILIIPESWF
ncbi:MAG: polysaccharide export protein [Gammaproteobacteria bacterium]|nr:polysaccharide export protein [Gammaproteobacteria bacterium]